MERSPLKIEITDKVKITNDTSNAVSCKTFVTFTIIFIRICVGNTDDLDMLHS